MARNRRVIVYNIPYFVTCCVLPGRVTAAHTLGPCVLDALAHIGDRWGAELHAYVIMPDHWHALMTMHPPHDISKVMNDLKTRSALYFNSLIAESGSLWQPRFHDHVCRNEEDYGNAFDYLHNNPVKAEFVTRPEDWPWSSWFAYAEGGKPPLAITPVDATFDARWVEWCKQPAPRHRH